MFCDPSEDNSVVARAFQDYVNRVDVWFNSKPNVAVSRVQYHSVLREPKETAASVAQFLHVPLDIEAMARQVDETLCRQRRK